MKIVLDLVIVVHGLDGNNIRFLNVDVLRHIIEKYLADLKKANPPSGINWGQYIRSVQQTISFANKKKKGNERRTRKG